MKSRPVRMRFGVFTLLILVGVVAGSFAYVRHAARQYLDPPYAREMVVSLNGELNDIRVCAPGWARLVLGDEYRGNVVTVHFDEFAPEVIPWIAKLPFVDELIIYDCDIQQHAFERLPDVRNLEALYVLGANLSRDTLAMLANCERLEMLSLNGSTISDEDLEVLCEMTTVSLLSLAGTGITDEGLLHLEKACFLDYLLVENTAVTPSGAASLKRACPHLRVVPPDGLTLSSRSRGEYWIDPKEQ